ncbi:Retrovirus-related Pol polyprotein LINE-1, partial [Aphis craccivora]
VPKIFLRNCKFIISTLLAYLFNLFLSSGTFPDIWKTSFIRPTPKPSSDFSNISNFRPISLLFVIPKMFEFLAANKIIFDLKNINNIIIDDQHGFIHSKITITNLLHF